MLYKICMIGTQFIGVPTDKGGAIEFLSFEIAKGLSEKNFSITYFSVDLSTKFILKNLSVERFPAEKTNAFFFSVFVFFKSLFKKFDAVYVSGCSMIFAGLLLSKIKRIPLVYHEFNHNPWVKKKGFFYDFLAKFSVRVSDKIIVPSSFIKEKIILEIPKSKSKVKKISNFVLLKEFSSKPKKKVKKILFVGRMVKHKGIDFLIELIQKNGFSGWSFVLVSPESLSAEEKFYQKKINSLKKTFKAKFFLKTALSREKLIQEFSDSSIFLLPSSQESFGLVLTEAMASFTPCIAFSVGGTSEIIDNNKNGFLVELGNKKEFEEKLQELIKNEEKRISFGLKAREKVEKNFSFNFSIKEFESFFKEVLVKK